MKHIPDTKNSLVLHTDVSDAAGWNFIYAAIREPVEEFQAYVDFVSDPEYDGLTTEQVLSLIPKGFKHSFMFIVDQTSLSHREHPIIVVDLYDQVGRTFRVIPSEMWLIENNLSLANMDFAEFADSVDQDGIFRGFREA